MFSEDVAAGRMQVLGGQNAPLVTYMVCSKYKEMPRSHPQLMESELQSESPSPDTHPGVPGVLGPILLISVPISIPPWAAQELLAWSRCLISI